MAKIQDCVEKSEDIKKHSYGREDSKGRLSKLCIWNLAGNDILGMAVRSQKIAGTAQELMGGEEIYHYHSKVCLSLKDNWEFVTIKMFYQLMMKEARTGGAWNWHQVEYQSGISIMHNEQEYLIYWAGLWILVRKWMPATRDGIHLHGGWQVRRIWRHCVCFSKTI